MPDDVLLDLLKKMMHLSIWLCAPVLVITMLIGFVVGLLQAMTSIQEQTLSFVPKLLGIGLVLMLLGSWMLRSLVEYTYQLFSALPHYGAL